MSGAVGRDLNGYGVPGYMVSPDIHPGSRGPNGLSCARPIRWKDVRSVKSSPPDSRTERQDRGGTSATPEELGSALAEMSRRIGVTNADIEALEQARAAGPAEPLSFE